MGILLGLSAAFWWGTSDFLAARVARHMGALRAILLTQTFGVVAIALILWWQQNALEATPRIWIMMLGIALLQTLCVLLFYRAFEIGKLSLVAPITSGFAVVTAALALLSGERPARLALLGGVLVIAGVLLVTRSHEVEEILAVDTEGNKFTYEAERKRNLRGVPEAILAAFGYGVVFWGLDFVVPAMGAVWPLAIMRLVSLACLSTVLVLWKPARSTPFTLRPILLVALGVSFADTSAWLSFNAGTRSDDVAIVTTLASLYSGVAIFFAWVFFREKLQKVQWLGVAVIIMGIVLVGLK